MKRLLQKRGLRMKNQSKHDHILWDAAIRKDVGEVLLVTLLSSSQSVII